MAADGKPKRGAGSEGCGASLVRILFPLVALPRAESTATTRCPCSRADTIRRAARLMRSASATDVPPNFITTVPDTHVRIGVRSDTLRFESVKLLTHPRVKPRP